MSIQFKMQDWYLVFQRERAQINLVQYYHYAKWIHAYRTFIWDI